MPERYSLTDETPVKAGPHSCRHPLGLGAGGTLASLAHGPIDQASGRASLRDDDLRRPLGHAPAALAAQRRLTLFERSPVGLAPDHGLTSALLVRQRCGF